MDASGIPAAAHEIVNTIGRFTKGSQARAESARARRAVAYVCERAAPPYVTPRRRRCAPAVPAHPVPKLNHTPG